jgi:hypothetical protein
LDYRVVQVARDPFAVLGDGHHLLSLAQRILISA